MRRRTITTLRDRLTHATKAFGTVPLRDLEHMTDEIAAWQAKLPERAGHGITSALRQTLDAAVRWKRMSSNPAKLAGRNPKPPVRRVRAYTRDEIDKIGDELSPMYRPLPPFAAATGLRPEEWAALQRRDIDRPAGVLSVRPTISSGDVIESVKTSASRRQVPLSPRALGALDKLPPRVDTPLLFPAPPRGATQPRHLPTPRMAPAIEAAAIRKPARIYDMRSTFASNSLAAGSTFSSPPE